MYISKRLGMDHTVLLANTPCLPFPNSVIVYGYNKLQQIFIGAVDSNTQCLPLHRKRSPDGATPN